MVSIAATVSTEVNSNQVKSFEHIVPIDLASIFTGYGPLPAVTGTKDQVGDWDAVGQTRTVYLSDGSSAQEVLTKYEHPHYFSYTVQAFTGILRFFTTHADGEWWFESPSIEKTQIKWRYAFNSKSVFAIPALWIIAKFLWRGYMKKALSLSTNQLEGNTA
jgi:hypothetical protein